MLKLGFELGCGNKVNWHNKEKLSIQQLYLSLAEIVLQLIIIITSGIEK